MKYKKSFLIICLIICLFSIAGVCASDVNETIVASECQSIDINDTSQINNNINEIRTIESNDSSFSEMNGAVEENSNHITRKNNLLTARFANDILGDEFDWQYVGDATTTGFGTNIPIYVSEVSSGFVLKDNLFNYQRFFSKHSDGNYYPNCYAENYLLPNIFKMEDSTYILTQGPGDSWYYKKLTYSKPKYSSIIVDDYDFEMFDYPFIGSGNQYSSVSIPVQVLDSNGVGVNGGIVVTDSLGNQVGHSYVTNGFTTVDISLSMSGKNKYDIQFNSANDNVESCSNSFYITAREQKVYVFLEGINNDDVITVKAGSTIRFNVTTLGASSGAMCFMWKYKNGGKVYAADSRNPVWQINSYYHPNCLFEVPEEIGNYILTIGYGFGSSAHDFDLRSSRSYNINVIDFENTKMISADTIIANVGSNISFGIKVTEYVNTKPGFESDDPFEVLKYYVTRSVEGGYISVILNDEEYQFPVIDGVAKINLFADGTFGSKSLKFNYKRSVIDFTGCSKNIYINMQPCNIDYMYENIVINPILPYNLDIDVLANGYKINGGKLILEFIDIKTGNVSQSYTSKVTFGKSNFNIMFPKDIRDYSYRLTYTGLPANDSIHYLDVYDSRIITLKSYLYDENNNSILSINGEYSESTTVKIKVKDEFNEVNNNSIKLIVNSKEYFSLIENNESTFTFVNEYVKNDTILAYYIVDGIEFPIGNFKYIVKGNSSINVTVDNIAYGESAKINIVTNVEGEVKIKVGAVEITSNTVNNHAVIPIYNLISKEGYYVEALFYPNSGNYRCSQGTAMFNVSKSEPKFNLYAPDQYYKQPVRLSANFKDDVTGSVKITICDKNGYEYKSLNATLSGGRIERYFNDLNVYNYTIIFEYSGNNNYYPICLNKTFNVLKIDPEIDISIINAKYDETAKIIVSSNAKGNASIYIDSVRIYENLIISNYLLVKDITYLNVGTYPVTVVFKGNNYNTKTYTSQLTITKAYSTITAVSINSTEYLKNTTLYIKGNVDGIVDVTIDGSLKKSHNRKINLMANTITPVVFENLPSGIHEASIKLNPTNKNYNCSFDYAQFNISKKDTFVNLNCTDFIYGENVIINVTASENGLVVLKVGDAYVKKNVFANIPTNFNFGVLAANKYEVDLLFDAGINYKTTHTNNNLIVNPAKPITEIQILSNEYGERSKIRVKHNIEGVWNIQINNLNKTANNIDKNRLCLVYLDKFDVGTYDINLTFDAGVNYTKNIYHEYLTVNPKQTSVTLNVNDNVYGNNVIVNITTNTNGNVDVKLGNIIKSVYVKANKATSVDFGILDVNNYNVYATFDCGKNYKTSYYVTSLKVSPKVSAFTIVDSNKNYKYSENVIIKIKTDVDGKLTVKLGNKTQTKQSTAGNLISFDFGVLNVNSYDVKISLDAGKNYVPSQKTTSITIVPKSTSITLNAKDFDTTEKVIVNVTASENGKVTMKLGTITKTTDVMANTVTSVDFGILNVGSYIITSNFRAGNNYVDSTVTSNFKVLSKIKDEDVNIAIPETIYNKYNDVVIKLPIDSTGTVTLIIKNNNYLFDVKNGIVNLKIPELDDGNYDYKIYYSGDSKYSSFIKSGNLNIHKITPTIILTSAVTTVYNGNKCLVATLKDVKYNAVDIAVLSINFNGVKVITTDKNGQVKISTNGLAPKTYTVKIIFSGDDNYGESTATVKVTVKKATPKLTAKAKTFKKSVKTKKYSITLKTNQNNVMKNTKLTLKVNGKTYTATTNNKGQATFKITKLTKKGKFTAVVKFAGNKYYNAKTVTAKITIK